jgi:hypothetical protein
MAKFKCIFCNRSFVKETTLASHSCPKKLYHGDKDEKYMIVAIWCYNKFLARNTYKQATITKFLESRHYMEFIKFARYVLEARIKGYQDFMEWLCDNNVKVDHWRKEATYGKFIKQHGLKESCQRALEKFVLCIQEWADEQNKPIQDFYIKANSPTILKLIRDGKLSLWIAVGTDIGKQLLSKMEDSELKHLDEWLGDDLNKWSRLIIKHQEDINWANSVLKEMKFNGV